MKSKQKMDDGDHVNDYLLKKKEDDGESKTPTMAAKATTAKIYAE